MPFSLYSCRTADPAAADAAEVLLAVSANNAANFTASFTVPAADVAVWSPAICAADGDQMTVYAVAQDNEGSWPGRWPNNSTMVSSA